MPSDATLQALSEVGPRKQPGFDEWIESLDVLRTRIAATPRPARGWVPQLRSRQPIIGLATGVALAAAAAVVAMTMTGASSPSAYAAAKKAVAATVGEPSGTMTAAVSHNGSSYTLDTTKWNGNTIEITRGDRSEIAPIQALVLIDGGAYVQQEDGSWLHYASLGDLGPKIGPLAQFAQDDVAGNTADQILSLATGITQSSQPDGSTVYTGTIPNSSTDAGVAPTDDAILRIIASLRTGNEPGAPDGSHDRLQLQMTVGSDGFVRQVSLTYQQQDATTVAGDGTFTWSITYNQLGSTPPIIAPANSTPAAPGTTTAPARTTAAP